MHSAIKSLPRLVLGSAIALASFSVSAETEFVKYNTSGQGGYQLTAGPSKLNSNGRFITYMTRSFTDSNYNLWLWDRAEDTRGAILESSVGEESVLSLRTGYDWDVSDDGQYLVFSSGSPNLVPDDTNVYFDIFLRDLATGETRRINVTQNGQEAEYPTDTSLSGSFHPRFTNGGKKVIYISNATNLSEDSTPGYYLYDIASNTTTRLPNVVNSNSLFSPAPMVSADGKTFVLQDAGKAVI